MTIAQPRGVAWAALSLVFFVAVLFAILPVITAMQLV